MDSFDEKNSRGEESFDTVALKSYESMCNGGRKMQWKVYDFAGREWVT